MKAEDVIRKEKYKGLKNLSLICDAMEEYAEALIKEEITEFYIWMQDNDHDHNIRMADMYLKKQKDKK